MLAYFKDKETQLEVKSDIHILVVHFLFSISDIYDKDAAELNDKILKTMENWAKEKGYDQ